jgi:hypothetical protein
LLVAATRVLGLDGPDPRTPAGQLAACGGARNWRGVGYLEFEVTVTTQGRAQGIYGYRWDRTHGYLRAAIASAARTKLDAAIDLGSKTGGAWENGQRLSGRRLTDAVSYAIQKFGEDASWLTFPLDWGAPGVTVKPLPDVPGETGAPYPAVDVQSQAGSWKVRLDPTTGRVAQTVLTRKGATMTVKWEGWQAHAGVFFAHRRRVAETGETIDVQIHHVLPRAPADAF